jgi:hypothetical protein
MEKLNFFKGLFFGLIMSAFMWGGIFWTIFQIDKAKLRSEVSEIKEPIAANLLLATIE